MSPVTVAGVRPKRSVRFGETLQLAGMIPSIGTVGDAYDNALAETTMGLYKTECTRSDSPFRTGPITTLADLEDITSAWVHWYNTNRLMPRDRTSARKSLCTDGPAVSPPHGTFGVRKVGRASDE
jgi:hypothetical protein